jgi:hypothetical protein
MGSVTVMPYVAFSAFWTLNENRCARHDRDVCAT